MSALVRVEDAKASFGGGPVPTESPLTPLTDRPSGSLG
jgi:hypothetical protein